jgi:glycosyl transferase family 87
VTGRRIRYGVTGRQSARWISAEDVDGSRVYAPSRRDPVVRAASTVVGGPAGRRLASGTGFWGAIPVLVLLAAAVMSFGVVEKQHCRAQGWSSPDQFWHACYSDIPVLYGSNSLGAADRPGLVDALGEGGLGQPPLSGALMWITSSFVSDGPNAGRHFFDLSAILLTVVLALAVTAVALSAGRRSWDAAHLALSPVLITAGLISYELLAVALLAAALLALARGRPVIGGVLLGLAAAAAPQVAVIGLVVALLAGRYLRIGSRAGIGTVFAGSALACWLLVRVALLPGSTGQLGPAWKGWLEAVPGYGSVWLMPQLLGASKPNPATSLLGRLLLAFFGWIFRGQPLGGTAASILSLAALAVLVAVILRFTVFADPPDEPPLDEPPFGALPFGAPADVLDHGSAAAVAVGPARFVTDKVAPLSLALLAALLLTAKSLPIQVSLLLLPLIALSGLRWRDHLIWAATEVVYFVAIWLYIAAETTPNRGLPAVFYLLLLIARLAGIAWIGAQGVLAYRLPPDAAAAEPDPERAVENPGRELSPVDRFLPS